jgi:hypothetical protein
VRYGAIYAGLVFLWCQAMIVLIRPVFTWRGDSAPKWQAVKPIQTYWPWLVALAFVVAITRVMTEDRVVWRSRLGLVLMKLKTLRSSGQLRRDTFWRSLPIPVQVILGAMLITLILAGTYVDWADAIAVLLVTTAGRAWRAGLLGEFPRAWMRMMGRIPVWLRFTLVPLLGFIASFAVLGSTWSRHQNLRPVMVGALATVVLFYLLLPRSGQAKRKGVT